LHLDRDETMRMGVRVLVVNCGNENVRVHDVGSGKGSELTDTHEGISPLGSQRSYLPNPSALTT
jgi:hypothetical protein